MTGRAEKVRLAQEMRARGLLVREIAAEMGVSVQSASAWLNDPDLAKQKARRAGYAGECVDCGGPTDGSNGPANAPERCDPCRKAYEKTAPWKVWTREAVIDAIQRFAAVHGRPPSATEWILSDPVNGYPARTSVYGSGPRHRNSPFAKWSDAIRAAGFEGNATGRPAGGPKTLYVSPGRSRAA